MADGLFSGIKVIELGHMIAMPSACTILADNGAEVIKIENPAGGDPLRKNRKTDNLPLPDIPLWFELENRGKRSFALDITTTHGREILHTLVKDADVFATNYQASLLKRIEADYDTLSNINPRMVYALLTGYGSAGPDKDKAGFDNAAFWARSGIMDRISDPPIMQRPGLGDNLASMVISGAISAALFHRERTQEGQMVDLNLYQIAVWGLSWDVEAALHYGKEINRRDEKKPANPLWNSYQTKDGKWLQLVIVQTDLYWDRFCRAIDRPDLINDPRFDSHEKRMQESLTLAPMIAEIVAGRLYTEWDEIFGEYGLLYGVVYTPLDVVNDPQAWANDFFTEIEHPVVGPMKLLQSPLNFSRTPSSIKGCAPELGQHTEEVLLELGYDWDDIVTFKNDGTIP